MAMCKKSLINNILCAAAGILAVACGTDLPLVPAAVFIVAVLWLCNELWYWCMAIPMLMAAAVSAVTKKPEAAGTENKFYRLTSFLLLVVPHLLFALLSFIGALFGEQLSEQLGGLTFSTPLFACSYLSVVALWLFSLRLAVVPLSAEVLWMELFENPGLMQTRSATEVAEMAAAQTPPVPQAEGQGSAPDVSAVGEAPRHPQLQAVAAELIWYGRAAADVYNRRMNPAVLGGGAMLVVAIIMLCTVPQLYGVSLSGCALCGVLGLGLGCMGMHLLRTPSRWAKKLRAAEYALSPTTVYIAEGDTLRTLPLDKDLKLHFELVSGTVGSIFMDHPSLHSHFFGKLLTKAGGVDTTHADSDSAPLAGFVHIADAAMVHELIKSRQ